MTDDERRRLDLQLGYAIGALNEGDEMLARFHLSRAREQLAAFDRRKEGEGGEDAWAPIETAPKDGLILCLDNYGPQVWEARAYWQSMEKDAPPKLPITEAKAVTKWCAIPPWADAARTEGKGNG